jgi:hypothetical protein
MVFLAELTRETKNLYHQTQKQIGTCVFSRKIPTFRECSPPRPITKPLLGLFVAIPYRPAQKSLGTWKKSKQATIRLEK